MEHFSLRRLYGLPIWTQILLVAGVVVLVISVLELIPSSLGGPNVTETPPQQTITAASSPTATPSPTATSDDALQPAATRHPTLTPPSAESDIVYALLPYADHVGWVASGEAGNHFGDSHLYTGFSAGKIYHGAFQFDLSFLPPGTFVYYAALELTESETEQPPHPGTWAVQMLGPDIDLGWSSLGFDQIHRADIAHTLLPTLTGVDLSKKKDHVFVFDAAQRGELRRRVDRGVVSFRIDGPVSGDESLFSWDSGYGSQSSGKAPLLRIAVALPAVQATPVLERLAGLGTPTPTFVVITSVPTPVNMLTAAAQALVATSQAIRVGTPTPLPPNWVTPIVVTSTPKAADDVTATAWALIATAEAVLTGTPAPTPGNVWTATPTRTYVVVTSVPTPGNTLTAVADALAATARATTTGTPTPLPPNWVTPIIVTAPPQPANGATATAEAAAATYAVMFTGTPTPTPVNVWTATPTGTLPPTPTSTSTPIPPTPTPPPTPTLPPPPPPPPPTATKAPPPT